MRVEGEAPVVLGHQAMALPHVFFHSTTHAFHGD